MTLYQAVSLLSVGLLLAAPVLEAQGLPAPACAPEPPPGAEAFTPRDGPRLAGDYRLVLRSEAPADTVLAVSGLLRLWPPDTLYQHYEPHYQLVRSPDSADAWVLSPSPSWTRGPDRPLIGTAVIDLSAVGAPADSTLASPDPMRPGLRLSGNTLQVTPPPLGYVQRDGFSTSLSVEWFTPIGFGGHWTTDWGYLKVAVPRQGRFCAFRLAS